MSPTGLLDRAQAARFLSISNSYLKFLDLTGSGPVRVRLGRRSLYRVSDLEEFARRHLTAKGANGD